MITQTLPAYPYLQYADDQNVSAFFTAYNNLSNDYLAQINALNLPVYTGLSGALLDFVALGVYGQIRPTLSAGVIFNQNGVYDTVPYDETAYSEDLETNTTTTYTVTDDYFKRILTWNLYKGDGYQFTCNWLKRRVKRFLYGLNGIDFAIDNTYEISVSYSGNGITIKIPTSQESTIFQAAVENGILNLPFQYSFTITLV